MTEHDRRETPPDLEAELRGHYADDADAVAFTPLDGAAIALAAGRRRRATRWGLVAAALVLMVAGVMVVPRLVGDQRITATPAPTGPSPVPSQDAGDAWYQWVQRADAPLDVLAAGVAGEGGSYYFAMAEGSCTQLAGYRYDRAGDRWSQLPSHEVPSWACGQNLQAHAEGDDIYLASGDYSAGGWDTRPRDGSLYVYHTATQRWEDLPSPEHGYDTIVGVDEGLVYLAVDLSRGPEQRRVMFAFFDYRTRKWSYHETPKDAPSTLLDAMADQWRVNLVRVEGRSLILFRHLADGVYRMAVLDPVDNTIVSSASVPLPGEVGEIEDVDDYQVAEPGWLYLGPDQPGDEGTEGLLIDLATGKWHTVTVRPSTPRAAGRLDAGWVKHVYPEAARYVVIGGHLHEPAADRWFEPALPRLAPPDLARPESEGSLLWDDDRPGTMCDYPGPGECWELVADPLAEVVREAR
ncbi:MAG: hypothetical protein QM804_00180 [Propionicimonas sp.]